MRVTVKVERSAPPDLSGLDALLSKVVRKTAMDIKYQASSQAPVKYGALRASIYVKAGDGFDDSAQSIAAAQALNPKIKLAPAPGTPANELEAIVAVGVDYGPHVEYGTVKQGAHPYMIPAMQAMSSTFQSAVAAALRKVLGR